MFQKTNYIHILKYNVEKRDLMRILLAFHGLSSYKEALYKITNSLSSYYDKIIVYDLPGHGDNKIPFKKNIVIDYVTKLYDNNKGNAKIDILGYSLGGLLASYLATIRVVDRLILIAPAFSLNTRINTYKLKYKKGESKKAKNELMKMIEFLRIKANINYNLSTIYSKTLIVFGYYDNVVSIKGVEMLTDHIDNPNKYIVNVNANHINILNNLECIYWIKKFLDYV